MTFVLTATKVLNILSKTLKDAVSGFFEFYSLREGGGLLKKPRTPRSSGSLSQPGCTRLE